ncbi:EcsC family protein [Cellulomonas cellasea]|uniref:EcsC family protein n=1 Tax=Cellulomonas cellasea TaxID=43670 RepID=A0A7W4YBN0_9CELL|nr:EcsC family protein [Cellulomonas cellasea]MBB2924085.1 hypothetical protein [Cellulomonas cellasea]
MAGNLSSYEEQTLREVEEHRARQLERSPRRLVPTKVRAAATRTGRAVGQVPGAQHVAGAYTRAAGGLTKAFSKVGQRAVSTTSVLKAYQRRGVDVTELGHIRELDLEIIERKVRPKHADVAYASLALAEGAVAGGVITGGEALFGAGTVFGVGVGGAPGLGVVAGAIATDTAFTLTLMNRAVAHTALYYGYDPSEPAEAVFAMSILSLGSATTGGAKLVAYQELSQLTQLLARRATWDQLNAHVLPQVATRFAHQFGLRISQRKLGAAVPLVGIAVGAGLNYAMLDAVVDAAYWAYRERFLREKSGDLAVDLPSPDTLDADASETGPEAVTEAPIDVIALVEEVLADEAPQVAGVSTTPAPSTERVAPAGETARALGGVEHRPEEPAPTLER